MKSLRLISTPSGRKATRLFIAVPLVAYIREDDLLPRPVPLPQALPLASHELCDGAQSAGVTMDKENPFYDRFKI